MSHHYVMPLPCFNIPSEMLAPDGRFSHIRTEHNRTLTSRLMSHQHVMSLVSIFRRRREDQANPPTHPFILYIYGSLRVTRNTNLNCPPPRVRSGRREGFSKPEWPNLVPIFYGHHDLSALLLGTVPTKRSELVDTVEPTSS